MALQAPCTPGRSYGNEERNDASPTPPLVTPHAALSARGVVEVQLSALQRNDEPRRDHGLETAYLFAAGTGGFGLSRYFGFSADLYHMGHFALKFRTHRGALVDHVGFHVLAEAAAQGDDSASATVDVAVRPRDAGAAETRWRFVQVRGQLGKTAGCWLTDSVMPLDAS